MRGKRGQDFTVSADGSKVRFGLEWTAILPVLFDLTAGRLTDQPDPVDGLVAPDVEGLKVTDWRNDKAPKLDGKPLQLQNLEESRALAVALAGDRFVLGTEWWLRAFDKNGKSLWRKQTPGIAWGVNITPDGRLSLPAMTMGPSAGTASDGEEILALFVQAKTREWVLWTPQGYYASSLAGDQYIGWHLNKGWEQAGDFVTAARLKKASLPARSRSSAPFEFANAESAVREAGLFGFKLADLSSRTPPGLRIVEPRGVMHAERSPLPYGLNSRPETNR